MAKAKRINKARKASAPVAQAVPANAPTCELAAHHEAILPPVINRRVRRPGWQIRTRLEGLLAIGAITPGGYEAAMALSDDWHCAAGGRGSLDLSRLPGGGGRCEPIMSQLLAIARLRRATGRLGEGALWLIVQCAALDRPWSDTAAQLAITEAEVKAATAHAINRLDPNGGDRWTTKSRPARSSATMRQG